MNAIFTRTSVRKFEDRPVEKEKIENVLQAGFVAPSAGNQQPWEFYVVTKREMIEELSRRSPTSTVRLPPRTSGSSSRSSASAAS